ncbi:MAG TPA: hypothetical protein VKI44_03960 [Acetobacteraceae bacterium]|nr:hypothetical protein [Acetobacteraceae bacterium]
MFSAAKMAKTPGDEIDAFFRHYDECLKKIQEREEAAERADPRRTNA